MPQRSCRELCTWSTIRNDIFKQALENKTQELRTVDCTDRPGSKGEFAAVYRLVRVVRNSGDRGDDAHGDDHDDDGDQQHQR